VPDRNRISAAAKPEQGERERSQAPIPGGGDFAAIGKIQPLGA